MSLQAEGECCGGYYHGTDFRGYGSSDIVTFPIPDTDINGIGVVLAFSVAAFTSYAVCVGFYLKGCVPKDLMSTFERDFINPGMRDPKIVEGFQKTILVVNEQHMVTAIGVLGASFVNLRSKTMFDFQTILYLAWMATNMQLSTLSILRSVFQDNPILRAFRLFFMLVLLVMMCVAIFPTLDYDWADHTVYDVGFCGGFTSTVGTHWDNAYQKNRRVPQGFFSYAIIIVSNIWQATMLFPKARKFIQHHFRRPLHRLEDIIKRPRPNPDSVLSRQKILHRFIIGVYMLLLVMTEAVGSWLFAQFLVGVHLAWCTFQLYVPRFRLLPDCVGKKLNVWNFGQILPMLLLIAPLYSAVFHSLRNIHHIWAKFRPQGGERGADSNPQAPDNTGDLTTIAQRADPSNRSGNDHSGNDQDANNQEPSDDLLFARTLFETWHFKTIFSFFWVLCVMSVVAYFMSASFALLRHEPEAWISHLWYEISWKLYPALLAAGASFFIFASLSVLFSGLSTYLAEQIRDRIAEEEARNRAAQQGEEARDRTSQGEEGEEAWNPRPEVMRTRTVTV